MKSLLLLLCLVGCADPRPINYGPPTAPPPFVPMTFTPMVVPQMQNTQPKTTTCQNMGNGQVICTTQ